MKKTFLDSIVADRDILGSVVKSRLNNSIYPKKLNKELKRFISNFLLYLNKKFKDIPFGVVSLFKLLYVLEEKVRFQLIRRLIWSRGKHGARFVHISLFIFVGGVFLIGTVFKNDVIMTATPVTSVYLSSENVITDLKVVRTSIASVRPANKVTKYSVQDGDTLSTIGEKFGVSADALRYSNSLASDNDLKVGIEISIPPVEGAVHTVASGDTLSAIASKYEVAEQAIVDFNYLLPPFELQVGDTLIIPDASIPTAVPSTNVADYASNIVQSFTTRVTGGTVGNGEFMLPTSVFTVSQYFYWYHSGLDLQSVGQSDFVIRASDSGTVEQIAYGWNGGYGNRIVVNHGNGFKTTYNHLEYVNVEVGQSVDRGQDIGVMGNTGRSTGRHLHFEIIRNGGFVDPMDYL
ncbi:MAG: M23 family metallopeptidase [bacterium]|nr:M23 family metallopeptidase [bacterium]